MRKGDYCGKIIGVMGVLIEEFENASIVNSVFHDFAHIIVCQSRCSYSRYLSEKNL